MREPGRPSPTRRGHNGSIPRRTGTHDHIVKHDISSCICLTRVTPLTALPHRRGTALGPNAVVAVPRSRSISRRRRILPEGDLGIASTISTARTFL